MAKSIFITGINGFLGHRLALHLQAAGYKVSGSSSSRNGQHDSNNFRIHRHRFGDSIDPNIFKGVDVVIHLAFLALVGDRKLNFDGTTALSRAARSAGVKYEIYFSSYSALTDVPSEYARSKKDLELYFKTAQSCAIVRPGLVIGDGGLFGKMINLVHRLPIVPLLDGGRSRIPIIGCSDLLRAIQTLIDRKAEGEFNLISSLSPTLKDILLEYRKPSLLKPYFLPVPAKLALLICKIFESLKIHLPIQSQNILGLIANQDSNMPSDLPVLVEKQLDLNGMIREASQTGSSEIKDSF